MRRLFIPAVLLALAACGAPVASGEGEDPPQKVFVCKYVSKPGEAERLQTGNNPISVSVNAIPGGASIGKEFADAQGRSVVIAFDTGQPEPSPSECPPPKPPPTTTTHAATTTTTHHVTTTSSSVTTTTCPDCAPVTQLPNTTTTAPVSTTGPSTTTGGSTTTLAGPTTTTSPTPGATTTTSPPTGVTTTTAPPRPFTFGAAATVCIREVPTIRIVFQNTFPELAGRVGTLTMTALDGEGTLVGLQELVYAPGTTVDILYPGTRVNADGTIADVPGWNLNAAGFWVRDPADEFLREGINLTYTVNPTATAFVTYPPESAACANPDGPFPPGAPRPPIPGQPYVPPGTPVRPSTPGLPPTK